MLAVECRIYTANQGVRKYVTLGGSIDSPGPFNNLTLEVWLRPGESWDEAESRVVTGIAEVMGIKLSEVQLVPTHVLV